MIKVLFICHGNICRSPMAEFVFKDIVRRSKLEDKFYIESAANSREEIGNDIHCGTKRKLDEAGISYTKRKARQMTKADYDSFDYIIGMDAANIKNICKIAGSDTNNKVFKLLDWTDRGGDIADPWYTGNFDVTYDDIREGCLAFLRHLNKEGKIGCIIHI